MSTINTSLDLTSVESLTQKRHGLFCRSIPMPIVTNRRSFLMAGSALLAGVCLPAATLAAAPVRTLEVGRRSIEVAGPAGTAVPVFARREGDTKRTGIILAALGATIEKFSSDTTEKEAPLDLSFEQGLVATMPLSAKAVDARLSVMLTGSMSPYAWTMDDRAWSKRKPVEVVPASASNSN